MASAFQYSETSAFTPVQLDMYDYTSPTDQQHPSNIDIFQPPMNDYNNRHLQHALIEQWVSNLYQPNYESNNTPLRFLSNPYLHEYFGEPGFIRKRNERERMRVRSVNEGYARLRDHLPLEPTEKRLSKVETLRGAIKYIQLLESTLKGSENSKNNNESCNKIKKAGNEEDFFSAKNITQKQRKHMEFQKRNGEYQFNSTPTEIDVENT